MSWVVLFLCFFFQAEDGIRDRNVTGVQTCALPISLPCGREHPACDLGCPTWQHRSGLASGPQQYGSRWPCVEHARRSEERRVGKECRSGGGTWGGEKRMKNGEGQVERCPTQRGPPT